MDQARLVDSVFDPDAEPLTDLGPDAEGAIGLLNSIHRRRLAVDLDDAAMQPQHRLLIASAWPGRRGLRARERRQGCRGRSNRQHEGTP